jgi:hypothetical protein
MDEIFQLGLHEFIETFIADNDRLGQTINQQYLAGSRYPVRMSADIVVKSMRMPA